MRARLPALGGDLNKDRGLCASAGYYLCNHARLRITCVICERAYKAAQPSYVGYIIWLVRWTLPRVLLLHAAVACCMLLLHAAAIVAKNTEMSPMFN